jgi:hypothetical protein
MMFALLTFALAVRIAWVCVDHETLLTDRDAYLEISENLAYGNGFAIGGHPTAYRPPLYSMMLGGLQILHIDLKWGLAVLQVLLGTATVGLTLAAGILLGLGRGSLLAGLFVALDPLLVRYTTMPMTETLATFLAAQLLLQMIQLPAEAWSLRKQATVGFLFGLAVLCRPTFWAWAALLGCGWIVLAVLRRRGAKAALPSQGTPLRLPWAVGAMALVTVAPWVVRNTLELHRPVVTTTHGGYTLLLGNNPVFYNEVVSKPWGTVWKDQSLRAWQNDLEETLRKDGVAENDEVARDRWFAHRARKAIAAEPGMFAAACWLRLRRFLQLIPLQPEQVDEDASAENQSGLASGEAAQTGGRDLPKWILFPVALFNLVLISAFVTGLIRLARHPDWTLWAVAALPIAFALVHCVYWSNARMRAPVVPAMALFAVYALCGWKRGGNATTTGS